MGLRLDQDQVKSFRDNGYLIFKEPVFDPEAFERLCAIFEEHVASKGESREDELDTPHFEDPRLLEFLLSERVLDIVEGAIGSDIGLFSSHFISKEPEIGRPTPWHEDSAYWKDQFSDYTKIVTVWLALDKVDMENGCMQVVPGTHVNGFSEYQDLEAPGEYTFSRQIKDIDTSSAVPLELEPNQASLHDSRIIHGASGNRSKRRRAGYTMRYFSTDAKVSRPNHPVWLARGRDLGGNHFVNA
jgi:ectoine hydroxylase-related dioxygenase (phytanoyl-CoA dioxygenase family)